MQNTTLDSNLEGVDLGESMVLDAARRIGFDEDALHEIGVSVRETLVNAVSHGNRFNKNKKVRLAIGEEPGCLTIEIADEGGGFDTDTVPDPLGEQNILRQSGRGLLMIRAYMDEVDICPCQPKGTLVRMVKRLAPTA